MSTSGERKAALKKLKNLFFTAKSEVKDYREKMDSTFGSPVLPNRVECTQRDYSGVECDVLAPELYNTRRIIFYIHGGCFVGGSRKAYRPFVAQLATAVSARAIIPEFRLAPTHAYPASLEDVHSVFRALYTEELVANSLDSNGDTQKSIPEIIIMADGSGASIAMGLMFNLGDKFKAAVKQIILFSPWLDLAVNAKKFTAKKSGDELISGESMRRACELYTFQDNRDIPLVSAVNATPDLVKNFPPVYIQVGSEELVLDDADKLQQLLMENNNKCVLDVWPGMCSMFQMADEELEESHKAIEKIGKMFTARKVESDDSQTDIQLTLEKKEGGTETWN